MKMQGYNGSQLWDTAFASQAIYQSGLAPQYLNCVKRIQNYLDVCQVAEEVDNLDRCYRHVSVGAWPFSTRDHGWPISDCTGEALTATLQLSTFKEIKSLPEERLFAAINVILSLQNGDGGWATYELRRGAYFVEMLNPSETFHGIMIDYPYVECSASCIKAMALFQSRFPSHRTTEINKSIARGVSYIKRIQRRDGSWRGSWGVCFTYGTWFAIQGLVAAGESLDSPTIKKAIDFLISKQRKDGGWGESFQSCLKMDWVEHTDSQVVNTSWAAIALMLAGADQSVVKPAIKLLIERQLPNGDWKQEGISGVFSATCAISYSSYKNVFSIWALGLYAAKYPGDAS